MARFESVETSRRAGRTWLKGQSDHRPDRYAQYAVANLVVPLSLVHDQSSKGKEKASANGDEIAVIVLDDTDGDASSPIKKPKKEPKISNEAKKEKKEKPVIFVSAPTRS